MHYFDSLETWKEHADLVVTAEITDAREGPRTELPDEIEISRDLTLNINEVHLGDASRRGTSFVMRSHEPWIVVDGERIALTSPGCVRLEVGDRIIAGLVGDGLKSDSSALLNSDSVFFVAPDGSIYDTGRVNPAVEELERLSEEQLVSEVRAAVAKG